MHFLVFLFRSHNIRKTPHYQKNLCGRFDILSTSLDECLWESTGGTSSRQKERRSHLTGSLCDLTKSEKMIPVDLSSPCANRINEVLVDAKKPNNQ